LITPPNLIEVDYGTALSITFHVEGGRSPSIVQLSNTQHTNIINWTDQDADVCTGTYTLTCVVQVDASDVNYSYDGEYTITAKNYAKNNVLITETSTFTVTVIKDVSSQIDPSMKLCLPDPTFQLFLVKT